MENNINFMLSGNPKILNFSAFHKVFIEIFGQAMLLSVPFCPV